MRVNFRRYVIPLGSWASLILGLIYLIVFWSIGGQGDLAVALSLFAVSLSIKAYGNSTPLKRVKRNRSGAKQRRKIGSA